MSDLKGRKRVSERVGKIQPTVAGRARSECGKNVDGRAIIFSEVDEQYCRQRYKNYRLRRELGKAD
jgi:hypothetical protein